MFRSKEPPFKELKSKKFKPREFEPEKTKSKEPKPKEQGIRILLKEFKRLEERKWERATRFQFVNEIIANKETTDKPIARELLQSRLESLQSGLTLRLFEDTLKTASYPFEEKTDNNFEAEATTKQIKQPKSQAELEAEHKAKLTAIFQAKEIKRKAEEKAKLRAEKARRRAERKAKLSAEKVSRQEEHQVIFVTKLAKIAGQEPEQELKFLNKLANIYEAKLTLFQEARVREEKAKQQVSQADQSNDIRPSSPLSPGPCSCFS